MDELIGGQNISAAMFDEMLLVAYEYNSQQPRFYSKFFSTMQPGIYDIQMSLATGGSSAAPVFFQPQKINDQYGMKQLVIDGGIIGNNPAMYAFLQATRLNKITKPLRIISMGTGVAEITKIDPTSFTRFDWLKTAGDRAIDNDVFAADVFLKNYFTEKGTPGDYVRM